MNQSWSFLRLIKGESNNHRIKIQLPFPSNKPYILIMKTTAKHISLINVGDTIIHEGKERTVCQENIKFGFCGKTLFGDSYRAGTLPVTVVIYKKP